MAIGDLGELGPLDVQVRKHNEMAENSSGLDFNESMEAGLQHVMRAFRYALVDIRTGTRVSTRLAGDFATKIAASIAAPMYAQIDPNRVGEMQRAITIALEYGVRLNALSNSLANHDSLRRLVADYPSHSFVIDRKEAGELFTNVSHPTKSEVALYERLWSELKDESDFGPVVLSKKVTKEKYDESSQSKAGDAEVRAKLCSSNATAGTSTAIRKSRSSSKNNE